MEGKEGGRLKRRRVLQQGISQGINRLGGTRGQKRNKSHGPPHTINNMGKGRGQAWGENTRGVV